MASERVVSLVKEALQSAKDNGHTFDNYTQDELASDMLAYDAFIDEDPIPSHNEIVEALKELNEPRS